MTSFSSRKVLVLIAIIIMYVAGVASIFFLLEKSILPTPNPLIDRTLPQDSVEETMVRTRIRLGQAYIEEHLVVGDGHVRLYVPVNTAGTGGDNRTNSEAVTYRLLLFALQKDKEGFDQQLAFIEEHMLHPEFWYLMWRLEDDSTIVGDGRNVASDADLRMIRALLLAEEEWGDTRYTQLIDAIGAGLEAVAVTEDSYLAPYGGAIGNTTWVANEVYLSYADFEAFDALAKRRGDPWPRVRSRMSTAFLDAQIHNGLYNSYLSPSRDFGNGIDGGGYSINSLWMMVRAAQSNDPALVASARRSLAFYKERYAAQGELASSYSSDGYAMGPFPSAWTYALVGRAAIMLGDREFAEDMITELLLFQEPDGSIPEGDAAERRVGQFTNYEALITLQQYHHMEVGR